MPACVLLGRAPADIAATAIGVLGVGYYFKNSGFRIQDSGIKSEILLWLLLYALALISTAIHAPDALGNVALWVRFLLFYAALRVVILPTIAARHVALGLLIAIALAGVDTYWQYFTGTSLTGHPIPNFGDFAGMRLSGPLSNYNIGNVLLKLSLLALAFGLIAKLRPALLLAVCAPALLLIPLSGERSITVVMIAIVLASALVLMGKEKRLRLMALAGLALAIVAGGVLYHTQSVVAARADLFISQLGNYWNTVYGQLTLGGWYQFLDSPWIGAGVTTFYDTCLPMQEAGRLTYCDMHPHNIYLQWLSGAGVFALLGFLAWVGLQAWAGLTRIFTAQGSGVFPPLFAASALLACLFPFMLHQSLFSNWPAVLFFYVAAMATHVIKLSR